VEDRAGPQFRDVYDKSYDARYTYFTCRLLVTSCTHVRTASVRSCNVETYDPVRHWLEHIG